TPPDALLPKSEAPEGAAAPAENPHGAPGASPTKGGWGGAGSVFQKVMEAKRRGAAAVILAQHPTSTEPMLAFEEGGSAEARIPAVYVSAALAEQLLLGYSQEVGELDAGKAASSLPITERTVVVRADVRREKGTAHNVLGRVRGRSPGRTLVVGA